MPETKTDIFNNKRANEFNELWYKTAGSLSIEQRKEIGLSYLTTVVGLSDNEAENFVKGNSKLHQKVTEFHRGRYAPRVDRSEEHTSELQSHSFISYAVFCLKKKKDIKVR